ARAPRAATAGRAAARRRALRPPQGARGDGALSDHRARTARARRPRRRELPHGHRQPARGAQPLRRAAGRPVRPAVPRRDGVATNRGVGARAAVAGADPARYRGLRREALATLAYIGTLVQRISGARTPLRVTSTVRDERYQRALLASDPEATGGYSLYTTG